MALIIFYLFIFGRITLKGRLGKKIIEKGG